MTYKIDSKNVYKQAISLVFKIKDQNTKEINCPEDYTKFTIIADKEKYDFGNNSGYLVSSIPEKTSSFQLVYFDNEVEKTINFKERIVNVKLKDISTWSTEHLSKNWVTERTKTLRKVS